MENNRAAPETIRIGDYDLPAPMRVAPPKGTRYFIRETNAYAGEWSDHEVDFENLANGVCYGSLEDAELTVKAIKELLTGKVTA